MNPLSEPFRPVLRSQADLERAWRHLMEPLGFSDRSLWLMFVGADDRPLPRVTQIDDCPDEPGPDLAASFGDLARTVVGDLVPGGRLALLLSRPGGATPTDADRTWASVLVAACRGVGVPTEVVHLATDVDLVPLPLDTLSGAA